MANVTLVIPDELLKKYRDYVKNKGISLNAFIRQLLDRECGTDNTQNIDYEALSKKFKIDTKNVKWTREELHER